MTTESENRLLTQRWHLSIDGKDRGDFMSSTLLTLLRKGSLKPENLVWSEGLPDWIPLSQLERTLETSPTPQLGSPQPPGKPASVTSAEQPPTSEPLQTSFPAQPTPSPAQPIAQGFVEQPAIQPVTVAPAESSVRSLQPITKRVRGTVKSLHSSRRHGMIVPNEGERLAKYLVNDIAGELRLDFLEGSEVEFDTQITPQGLDAKNVVVLRYSEKPSASQTIAPTPSPTPFVRTDFHRSPKGKWLLDWAFVDLKKPHTYDDTIYTNVLAALARIALDENWVIGEEKAHDNIFPVLRKYLYATFQRASNQDKVFQCQDRGQRWAVFNTGLVDKVYDPIYLLFQEATFGRPNQPAWRLNDICILGKKAGGKKLNSLFNPPPRAASYFERDGDILIMASETEMIPIDDEHVINDAIKDDRYPPEFLKRFSPQNLEWEDYTQYLPLPKDKDLVPNSPRGKFLRKYEASLAGDANAYIDFKDAVVRAIKMALKRTVWNYKTAIPSYYPREDVLQLLLPLCLDKNPSIVSAALVVSRFESGSYQGRTIYPLEWAYEQARVVCRPQSDWLIPERIIPRREVAPDDQDTEQSVTQVQDTEQSVTQVQDTEQSVTQVGVLAPEGGSGETDSE